MNTILISACLLGEKVRYNGKDLFLDHPLIQKWQSQDRLIPICPEVAGGLPVPRAPAEIISHASNTQIINSEKQDVTEPFLEGAKAALKLAQKHHCRAAILTESSPSCGSQTIYDGSFSGTKIQGAGITTALLLRHNIAVFNQFQLEAVDKLLF